MSPGLKLGAYGLVLAASLGLGAVVGAAVGPIDVGGDPSPAVTHGHDTTPADTTPADSAPLDGHGGH